MCSSILAPMPERRPIWSVYSSYLTPRKAPTPKVQSNRGQFSRRKSHLISTDRERLERENLISSHLISTDRENHLISSPCDSCKSSPALLFCRADSAFLCSPCDSKVHGANKLASRHERVWMCEVCEQAPASVTCKADAAALCSSCDDDIHSANPLARRHERVPVLPFFHSPDQNRAPQKADPLRNASDNEEEEVEAESWLLPGDDNKAMEAPEVKGVPVGDQYFFSDVKDPYLDLDYAASMDLSTFHHMDSVVPVQNTSSVVGVPFHHHPPPFFAVAAPPRHEGSYDFDFTRSKPSYSYVPSLSHSVSSSEVGVVPDSNAVTDITNPYGMAAGGSATVVGTPAAFPAVTAAGMDREARVLRYREKRKNRKFQKTIRYASRKAYAEMRPRVKGRFTKRTELEGREGDLTVDSIYSSSAAAVASLMADHGYGVVPSF